MYWIICLEKFCIKSIYLIKVRFVNFFSATALNSKVGMKQKL